ncbi:MAG: hypothetical protein KDD50_15680 [Bdellovibrionales bacterium]|nr:hypothetical protein [Bdellovibrionales bacterium]
MANDSPVVKKKVQPYPIEALISSGTGSIKINIVKLTLTGYLADVGSSLFKVGESFNIQFVIPVLNKTIISPVKIIKTYDSWGASLPDQKVTHIVEMHFLSLPESHKEAIRRFLIAIKQV